ncbi:MAG: SDR family oxidoreductase [Gemmatimonadota bacterium]|nr:SDR family oxidoreductase [Gemmatimonadota bacterium]
MSGRTRALLLGAAAGGALAAVAVARAHRTRFTGASVLITGGSRGLGLELARVFAAEGARLTLIARDGEELRRAARALSDDGADVQTLECDLRDPERIRAVMETIEQERGGVDVLVNNAGVIQVGPAPLMDVEDFEEAFDVHLWGPLHLVRAVTPGMARRGRGHIVNISSIGGLVAIPHLLPYVASKFALTGFSDGLHTELAPLGIRVTTVCPGLMRTGSHLHAQFKGQHGKEYGWFSTSASAPLLAMDAARAARKIVDAARSGRARLVLTPQARLLDVLGALAPGAVAFALRQAASLLPDARGVEARERRQGTEARADSPVPSWVTHLGDEAADRNNQRPHVRPAGV